MLLDQEINKIKEFNGLTRKIKGAPKLFQGNTVYKTFLLGYFNSKIQPHWC